MTYGNFPDLSKVKKILVIKFRHLGDVLLSTPVFSALKRELPSAEIDALVYEEAKEILEGHPAIYSILGVNRKKKGLFGLFSKKYDLALNMTEGDRGTLLSWLSGAKIRVGFTPKGWWQKKILTHQVKITPGIRHRVERDLDVIRRIGIFPALEERELFLKRDPNVQRVKKPYLLVHPTSRWLFKCWDPKKTRRLIELFLEEGQEVVVTSGKDPQEIAFVESIVKDLPIINLAGKISLRELISLIDDATVLFTVDSLPFHIANALKKPVVALFGPTSDLTWGAWRNPNAEVIVQNNYPCRPCYQDGCGGSKHSDCLQTISLQRVLEAKIFSEIGLSCARVGEELIDGPRKKHLALLN